MSTEKVNLADWPLPDAYLIELGRISAAWVSLESLLDLNIGKLAGYDQLTDIRPFIVLRHSSFPQKLDAFEALCDYLCEENPKLKNYKETTSKIRQAQKSRNKFMHNPISKNTETGKFELAEGSARGKVKTSLQNVEPQDIKRVAMDIHQAMLSLYILITGMPLSPLWERRAANK